MSLNKNTMAFEQEYFCKYNGLFTYYLKILSRYSCRMNGDFTKSHDFM